MGNRPFRRSPYSRPQETTKTKWRHEKYARARPAFPAERLAVYPAAVLVADQDRDNLVGRVCLEPDGRASRRMVHAEGEGRADEVVLRQAGR